MDFDWLIFLNVMDWYLILAWTQKISSLIVIWKRFMHTLHLTITFYLYIRENLGTIGILVKTCRWLWRDFRNYQYYELFVTNGPHTNMSRDIFEGMSRDMFSDFRVFRQTFVHFAKRFILIGAFLYVWWLLSFYPWLTIFQNNFGMWYMIGYMCKTKKKKKNTPVCFFSFFNEESTLIMHFLCLRDWELHFRQRML